MTKKIEKIKNNIAERLQKMKTDGLRNVVKIDKK